MFQDHRPYWTVNREERSFVGLLAHLVLASPEYRARVCDVINSRNAAIEGVDPDNLEVYLEPSPLRDYWHEIGPYNELEGDTYQQRRAVLECILREHKIEAGEIDRHSFFWTGKSPGEGRLWNPGHWSIAKLDRTGWPSETIGEMTTIKRAWNSKLDLMLMSGSVAILVEAKLESGFGIDQLRNGREVAKQISLLSARFRPEPQLMTLTLAQPKSPLTYVDRSITWRDLLELPEFERHADSFTNKALGRIKSAYPNMY